MWPTYLIVRNIPISQIFSCGLLPDSAKTLAFIIEYGWFIRCNWNLKLIQAFFAFRVSSIQKWGTAGLLFRVFVPIYVVHTYYVVHQQSPKISLCVRYEKKTQYKVWKWNCISCTACSLVHIFPIMTSSKA